MKQTSVASAEYAGKKRQTHRERFLAETSAVVPWARLEALIEPHYPKSGTVGQAYSACPHGWGNVERWASDSRVHGPAEA